MVKIKEKPDWLLADGTVDIDRFIAHLSTKGYLQDLNLVMQACQLCSLTCHDHATETGQSCLALGLSVADVLSDLEMDQETLATAIVFESKHYADLTAEDIEEQLSKNIARLVKGIEKMSALHHMQSLTQHTHHKHQLDNVRKMLLAMVDDPRVVLIKLAERLCLLRTCANMPQSIREAYATEAMDIYAPLANRLGIGAVKWEMEDLAFRYLHPLDYKTIAKGLKSKRLEREHYVHEIIKKLKHEIQLLGISHYAVYGRSKHIHSIYRKMQRKNVSLNEIYDVEAVRVLVETHDQCYQVLSLVHHLFHQIPQEFDDYIMHPKPNGYQSLHTAVKGADGRVFEVQIRTFRMHDLAEMGVAAHWKYKEGGFKVKDAHERKIAWLRDVLDWHRDVALSRGISETVEMEFLEDRVYVFTPQGDVLDLPHGVTPLDFAYHVHSNIGHRCRGAKVNGSIVPLTYELKTGDRVEILTGKEEKPSRDWINPHLNYLKTARAKAKVLHWFKMLDYESHRTLGMDMFEKELKSLGLKSKKLDDVLEPLGFKRVEDLYAAIGRGDCKLSQVMHRLSPEEAATPHFPVVKPQNMPEYVGGDLQVEGVGNLLTNIARCCQPVPGDDVIGYITIGRGVSIHRKDCPNIIHTTDRQRKRFLEVSWGMETRAHYIVNLFVKAYDRPGLLRDVTALLSAEKANVHALQSQTVHEDNAVNINLTVEIDGLDSLSRLLSRMLQIPNIVEARRCMS